MFVWVIPNRLGKAGHGDSIPSIPRMVVAAEYEEAKHRLSDDRRAQDSEFVRAVMDVVKYLAMGPPVCVTCQQGRSRSVTVACLAAAMWEGKKFKEVHAGVKLASPDILDESPLLPMAQRLFPNQF